MRLLCRQLSACGVESSPGSRKPDWGFQSGFSFVTPDRGRAISSVVLAPGDRSWCRLDGNIEAEDGLLHVVDAVPQAPNSNAP